MNFIQGLFVGFNDTTQPEEIITYESLFQEATQKYCTLLTHRGGHPIITRKSLKMSQSILLQIKLISKQDTVVKTPTLVEIYLPSELQLVTSVAEGAVSKGITNPIEMAMVGIHPINQ